MTDLISLVLKLKPIQMDYTTGTMPTWWGRAAHAMLLDTIKKLDDRLALELHESKEIRPFTVSSLNGTFDRNRLLNNKFYTLRLTGLSPQVAGLLYQAAQNGGCLAPDTQIELDYHPFRITETHYQTTGADSLAGISSYQELSAKYLLDKESPDRNITLKFVSPTTFKSSNTAQRMNLSVPLPNLVFGSLLRRWNEYSNIKLPKDTLAFVEGNLALSRYDLKSRSIPGKSGSYRIGCVGEASYVCLNDDRFYLCVLHTLASYALYSGIGAGTTWGMGQSQKL